MSSLGAKDERSRGREGREGDKGEDGKEEGCREGGMQGERVDGRVGFYFF